MSEYPEEYAEIDGRIALQAQLLLPQGSHSAGNVFPLLIEQVPHKLKAMLYHKGRFFMIEHSILEDCIKKGLTESRIPHSLFFEFEAFLFQTKSALDISIKLLAILFPDIFKTNTFSDKGDKLIKNLNDYKNKIPRQLSKKINDKRRLGLAVEYRYLTIDNIIQTLEGDKATWLCKAIAIRDTVSHYKASFNLEKYSIEKENDDFLITLPKILEVYPRQFLEITYQNCIEFIQEFICLFIELWMPPLFAITQASDSHPTLTEWRSKAPQIAKYIKYTLAIRKDIESIN